MGSDGSTKVEGEGANVAHPASTLPDAVGNAGREMKPVPLSPGVIVDGRFRIEEALGEGGMGLVYRATQLSIQRSVALKVLRSELAGDEQMVMRFVHEARSISRLSHPNIVTVLDYGRADAGNLYIVMEFVQGCLLADRIDLEGALPHELAVDIAAQILAALSHAHGQGVIHRDLKPSNVMLIDSGRDECFVKLLDFGVAKIVDDLQSGPALTRTGIIIGTPKYMAPEQALGESVDARVDLYAVGVMLYEMLTGDPPFQASAARELLMKQIHETPRPFAREIGEKVPARIQDCVARALAKDAAKRFQSADEMRDALAGRKTSVSGSTPQRREGSTMTHAMRPRQRTTTMARGELMRNPPRGRILAYSVAAVGFTSLAFAVGLFVSKNDQQQVQQPEAPVARTNAPSPASSPASAPATASAPAKAPAPPLQTSRRISQLRDSRPWRESARERPRTATRSDARENSTQTTAAARVAAKLVVCVTCGGKKCRSDVWLNEFTQRASMECAEFAVPVGQSRVRASRDAFVTETRAITVVAPATTIKIDLRPIQ